MVFYEDGNETRRLIKPTIELIEEELLRHASDSENLRKKLKIAHTESEAAALDVERFSTSGITELNKSLSGMKPSFVAECLGIDLKDLLNSATVNPANLVPLRTENLEVLCENVYQEMSAIVNQTEFPILVPESMKQYYVLQLIRTVIKFMQTSFKLPSGVLKWSLNDQFKFPMKGVLKDIIPDIILYSEMKGQKKKEIKYLAVIECKKDTVSDVYKHNLVYMRKLYDLNGDDRTIFGFSSTALEFDLISYDRANGFKLCNGSLRLLFPEMFADKNLWLDHCKTFIKTFYSVLCHQIRLP